MKMYSFAYLVAICLVSRCINIHLRSQSTLNKNHPENALQCPEDPTSGVGECPDVVDTTCGWNKDSIVCVKWPCASNFQNKCFACSDPNVGYYSAGECPTDQPVDEEPKPDYGHAPTKGSTLCPADPPTVCTKELNPVCGWFDSNIQCVKYPCASNYSNPCMACADENVAAYTEGDCPNEAPVPDNEPDLSFIPKDATKCPELNVIDGPVICTLEYKPVCGYEKDGKTVTYSNDCNACGVSSTIAYTEGECKEKDIDTELLGYAPDYAKLCTIGDVPIKCSDDLNYTHKVCGWFKSSIQCITYPCAVDFKNECEACVNPDIAAYTEGECPDLPFPDESSSDSSISDSSEIEKEEEC